ncbi:hypothetical protein [Microseira sp. BLCC-F43]|jgi:hypothetical protein|uniref:hypothetical protein n=1 Tax=Microseira sp. BLCC-F43 TaxID=3153602 RepID=UPI0035B72CBD
MEKDFGQEFNPPTPQPGEIWELSRYLRSPLLFSKEEQQQLYSEAARRFLEAKSPPRYVTIVNSPDPPLDPEAESQVVSVMLMSPETNFLSDVDLLIPQEISGIGQDLLAETWHILPMLTCNLLQPVGRRLSREIYDLLMTVGDYYLGLVDAAPSPQEIQALGLKIAPISTSEQPEIQVFHRQEQAWSDVLLVPLAAYRAYFKGMKLTEVVLNEYLQISRYLSVETQQDCEI